MTQEADPETHTETTTHDNSDSSEVGDHLEDVDDGIGCAEVWEYMSEKREDDTSGDERSAEDGDEDSVSPEKPTSD
jgi:hypothetical protein